MFQRSGWVGLGGVAVASRGGVNLNENGDRTAPPALRASRPDWVWLWVRDSAGESSRFRAPQARNFAKSRFKLTKNSLSAAAPPLLNSFLCWGRSPSSACRMLYAPQTVKNPLSAAPLFV